MPGDARTVLITGCSTGIGHRTALHLHDAGWDVYAGVRRREDGEALAAAGVRTVLVDVTDRGSVEAAVAGLPDRLDGLVNNAGVYLPSPFEYADLGDVERMLAVNLLGAMRVTQVCLDRLRTATGRIVNVSSISGLLAMPGVAGYAASKFGLEAFGDSLRVELRPWNVAVIAVEPGRIRTPIWSKGAEHGRATPAPAAARDAYGPLYRTLERLNTEDAGLPPERVASVVEEALTARKPKARYPIGRDTAILSRIRQLPTAARDAALARLFCR